jgi:hypothetical protein
MLLTKGMNIMAACNERQAKESPVLKREKTLPRGHATYLIFLLPLGEHRETSWIIGRTGFEKPLGPHGPMDPLQDTAPGCKVFGGVLTQGRSCPVSALPDSAWC